MNDIDPRANNPIGCILLITLTLVVIAFFTLQAYGLAVAR